MVQWARVGTGLVGSVSAVVALRLAAPPPGALLALLKAFATEPQATVDSVGVETVVLSAVAAAAWGLLGWLVLAGGLILGSTLPGLVGRCAGAISCVVAPAAARHLLAAGLGIGLLAGLAGVAHASPPPAGPSPSPPAATDLDLDWPVERGRPGAARTVPSAGPTPPAAPSPDPSPPAAGSRTPPPVPPAEDGWPSTSAPGTSNSEPDATVLVRPGDSLWSITSRALGTGPTTGQVAAAWPQWWSANRTVIGDDPDLIQPGQRLTPPGVAPIRRNS